MAAKLSCTISGCPESRTSSTRSAAGRLRSRRQPVEVLRLEADVGRQPRLPLARRRQRRRVRERHIAEVAVRGEHRIDRHVLRRQRRVEARQVRIRREERVGVLRRLHHAHVDLVGERARVERHRRPGAAVGVAVAAAGLGAVEVVVGVERVERDALVDERLRLGEVALQDRQQHAAEAVAVACRVVQIVRRRRQRAQRVEVAEAARVDEPIARDARRAGVLRDEAVLARRLVHGVDEPLL